MKKTITYNQIKPKKSGLMQKLFTGAWIVQADKKGCMMFDQLIIQAIRERHKLHCTYHGTKKPRGRS